MPEATSHDLHRRRVHTQQQIHEIRGLLLEAADLLIELDAGRSSYRDADEVRLPSAQDGDAGAEALGQAGALTAAAQFKIQKVGELLGARMIDHPTIWAKGRV